MSYRDEVDTSRCYFCPKRNGIEVHHIVPQRFRGSDSRENLVPLCDKCHKKLERLYDKSFYQALGIDDAPGERKFHTECQSPNCDHRATREIKSEDATESLVLCEAHAWEQADFWTPDTELNTMEQPPRKEFVEETLEEVTVAKESTHDTHQSD